MLVEVLLSVAACLALAVAVILARRVTISVIVTKDPDMATIKERLAILESLIAKHDDTIAGTANAEAVATQVDALSRRINAVEADIGTDPEPTPEPAPAPAPAEQALDLGTAGTVAE